MPPITEVTILLPEKDAELFLKFQEHYDKFKLLLDRGVFDQKSGRVILHFDIGGTLQMIEREDVIYSRKHG